MLLSRVLQTTVKKMGLRENDENKFHHDNIGQNEEEGRQHNRVRGRATDSRSPTARTHSLKARDEPDDQAVDGGLECLGQESTESSAIKTARNELMKRERFNQSLRKPAREQ